VSAVRSMPAHAVSAALQERLPREPAPASVLMRTSAAIHVDTGGFVVSVVDRRGVLAPNAVQVSALLGGRGLPEQGDPALVSLGRVRAGDLLVTWDPDRAPLWEPRVESPAELGPNDAERWAEAILRELRMAPTLAPEAVAARLFGARDLDARTGLIELLGSVRRRDPGSARGAARLLTGRGPGLTPAGDDLIAGVAVVVAALGAALQFPRERQLAWHRAALLPDLADRTTAVSATLLRLATGGLAPEPLHGVLHGVAAPERGLRSLRRLLGIGDATGWAMAAAAGLSMLELAVAAAASPRKECA
jgi:hypothetical protein